MFILLSLTVCHGAVAHSVPFDHTRAQGLPIRSEPLQCLFHHTTQFQLESPCLIGVVRNTFMSRSLFLTFPMITRTSSMFVGASGVLRSSKSHSDPPLSFNLSLAWYRTLCPPSISVLGPTRRAQWYLPASRSLVTVCYHLIHSGRYQPNVGNLSTMAHSNIL